ncbi:MAG: hypothetical protein HFJ50_02065 [Clostridia bacterium]|jgi:hypothetical protein|nr:hypothetical protein [Clostridia bacterium]
MILASLVSLGIIILKKTKHIKDLKKVFLVFTISGLICLLPAQTYWHRYLSNVDNSGKVLEEDHIKLAKYLKREYNKVYVVGDFTPKYKADVRDIYGYLICDYEVIYIENSVDLDISGEKTALITTEDLDITVNGAEEKDLGTKYVKLYVSEGDNERLQVSLNKS